MKPVLGVTLLVCIMTSAIAWRVSKRPEMPGILPILGWQLVVWLPWIAYYFLISYLTARISAARTAAAAAIILHVVAALLIAVSHLAWYWQLSSHFSPFVGVENTKYGAYAFFFVFWFVIDLLLYWTVLILPDREMDREMDRDPERETNYETSREPESPAENYTTYLTVRKGRARHVVPTADINWIEAQGYYAGLHTDTGSFLIRKSLSSLENELDPERFVRVHRSTIVNIDQVKEIQSDRSGAVTVTLLQGSRRNVSRKGRRRLKELLRTRA